MNTKPIFSAAAVALATVLTICTGAAQTPAPAAPAAAPPAAAAPTAVATPPRLDMKAPAHVPRTAIVDADARNCLEFPSNQEIIKCAEKYLHRRAG